MSSALIADGRTWPLAFDLYLPVSWTDDAAAPRGRRHSRDACAFARSGGIALAQVRDDPAARASRSPASWSMRTTAATPRSAPASSGSASPYGVAIRGEATFALADVPGTHTATALAASAPEDAWESVTWGTGTAGPLTARFCALARPADEGRAAIDGCSASASATDERKYYLLHLPPTRHAASTLVALARSRWPIEQQYRELKDDLGLDHFEGRRYQGWAHHVVLTAVAFTFLQIERGRATDEPRPTLPVVRGWVREIMGLLYVIHNRRLLHMLDSFRRNAPLRR